MPVVRAASLAPRAGAVEAARKGAREAGRSEAESLDGVEHGALLGIRRAFVPCTQETFRSAILIAHDIHGIPMKEITKKRKIPLSTAYKWRTRAIDRFREIAEERYREDERLAKHAFALGRQR